MTPWKKGLKIAIYRAATKAHSSTPYNENLII